MSAEKFATGIIVFFAVWFVLFVLFNLRKGKSTEDRQRESDYYELNRRQYDRGTEARTAETARDALERMESGYLAIRDQVDRNTANCYEDDIDEVRSNYIDLMMEKWQNKADRILQDFIDLFLLITDVSFADVEKAHRSKDKCLAKYDAYWEWTREIYEECRDHLKGRNLWDEAKVYFRWVFTGQIENTEDHALLVWDTPANASTRQRIEKRLDACITAMQPEYKRKMQLRKHILLAISKDGTIQRSNLLGQRFGDFIESEVRACYNGLLREEQFVEVKQGARYFISLTEKGKKNCPAQPESAKANQKTTQDSAARSKRSPTTGRDGDTMIPNQEKLVYEAVIQHLKDENAEYVDKTPQGGGLYFFDKRIAEELKNKGYAVHYAEKGTKGTQYRAAWYMKFDMDG